jgi:hypothetical protein
MKKNIMVLIFGIIVMASTYAQNPFFIIDGELQNNGFVRFATNDRRSYNSLFYQIIPNPNEDEYIYEIDLVKTSGNSFTGFGIIFCADGTNISKTSCYVLLITINQQYMVGPFINGRKTDRPMIDWKTSENLNAGYNVVNTIKIVEQSGNYIIYFNGIETDSFRGNNRIRGKMIGVYIGIGSIENELFPQFPVDVQYMPKN